ncbi:hypothetical protein [Streptomyces sp. TRM68416]|uniref:hypothetical protein n=1 Tax=Streptomyces sp. TRM68416 TaxID=2758412 RepID=UPI002948C03B|nr:hypothetical protein [Streptomyces sp. TRM68416]
MRAAETSDVWYLAGTNLDESGAVPETAFAYWRVTPYSDRPGAPPVHVTLDDYVSAVRQKFGTMTDEFLLLYPATTDDEAALAGNDAIRDDSRVSTYLWATEWTKGAHRPVHTYLAAGVVAASGLVTGVGGTASAATEEIGSQGDIVVLHLALPRVPVNNSFTVKVRPVGGTWQRLGVYLAKLALIDAVTGSNPGKLSSWAAFGFSGTVEVEVTYNPGGAQQFRVRPDSYGIRPEVLGDTARFTLDRPRNIVVQVDDKIFDCLHLFANPVEENPPAEGDKKVMYFGPGFYTPSTGS